MTLILLTLGTGIVVVMGLSMLLLELGKECRKCPTTGPAATAATLSVMGAFTSIGFGVVALFAAFAGELHLGSLPTALVSTGGAAVVLGIGFSIAATALRDALSRAGRETNEAILARRGEAA